MTIDDLSDVEITNLQNGDILQYNNGFWRNVEYTSGSDSRNTRFNILPYCKWFNYWSFFKSIVTYNIRIYISWFNIFRCWSRTSIYKNTAFNKNFGSGHDDIPRGDHVHDYSTLTNIPTSFTPSAQSCYSGYHKFTNHS